MTEDEIAARTQKWLNAVDESVPQLADITMSIDNKEVVYTQTDDDKKARTERMKSFNLISYAKARGWINEDGTGNPLKIATDTQKIEDFEKIVKSIATQVKTGTTKETLSKIKNIDDRFSGAPGDPAFDSLEEAATAAKKKAGW